MYQKGRIYKLIDKQTDETLLIGSTTLNLSQKLAELKYNHNKNKLGAKFKHVYDCIGCKNIGIELMQCYPCNNIDELKQKENEVRRLAFEKHIDISIL